MGSEDFDRIRETVRSGRFEIWKTFLRDMEMTAENDHTLVRFPNSSSYIFSTGKDTFWLVDPAFSSFAENNEELPVLAELIARKFSFAVITHLHGDHCQMELVKLLKDSPLRWVVPAVCAEKFRASSEIPDEKILVLADEEATVLSGIRITAKHGYHQEPGKPCVPSAAYEILLPDKVRLLMPSDVRDFSASLPAGEECADYIFGHVFLGREDAAGSSFPRLDDYCRFMTSRKSRNLILAHLYEIGRAPRDMWCLRHARMVAERIRDFDCGLNVEIPRFGEALHLVRDFHRFEDPFKRWSPERKADFLAHLGLSIKMDHENWMERAVEAAVPVLEWMAGTALAVPQEKRSDELERWRTAGGKCLSIHLPVLPLKGEDPADFERAVELALSSRADRVTIHVPAVPAGIMQENFDFYAEKIISLCGKLLENNIRIGVENLHMKRGYSDDGNRPFGFTPPECVHLVETLRRKSSSGLWGIHFDIGHAYSNPPYHETYDTRSWLQECAPLLNGMHIHQFEHERTEEEPFLRGHGNVSGRNTGHPSLLPVFEAWEEYDLHVPMILEVMRGDEPDPFASLARLKREPYSF